MKVDIIKTDAKFAEKLDELRVTGKAIDLLIHRLAVSALYHYSVAWNWTKVKEVIDAMPKSSRRKALIMWVEGNASLLYKKKTDSLSQPKNVEDRYVNLEEAMATPFWDFSDETPDKPAMTLDQLLKFVKGKAKKAAEDGALTDLDLPRLHKAINKAFDEGVSEAVLPEPKTEGETPEAEEPQAEETAETTLKDAVGG